MASLITQGLGVPFPPLLLTLGMGGSSVPVTSFFVEGARPIGPLGVRVTFSAPPMAFDPMGANDALNVTLYSITGPQATTVTAAAPVTGDPLSVDLYLGAPLPAGDWVVTGDAAIQDLSGNALAEPREAPFAIALTPPGTPVQGGAVNEGFLRRHLNPALAGFSWDNLIAAVEGDDEDVVGDAYVARVARLAYDQLFLTTASGPYLDRRAAEVGVSRPDEVGLKDEPFRQLALTLANNLITDNALHDVLEVFYGPDALHATLTAGITEPYALQDGDDLTLTFGRDRQVLVEFDQLSFARIATASATEVAAAIARAIQAAGIQGAAAVVADPVTGAGQVRVYADARGTSSAIRVTGGRAQATLRFPEDLFPPGLAGPFGTWTIAASPTMPGRLRLSTSPTSPYDLLQVRPDDRVLIYGREFPASLTGTHDILAVSVTYPGGVRSAWIEIDGANASTTVTQLAENSLVFLRPSVRTIHDQPAHAYVADVPGGLEAVLPATSPVVARGDGEAGYLSAAPALAVALFDRDAAGLVTVTTVAAHGLAVGDRVLADGMLALPAQPATSAGSPSAGLGVSHL